MTRKPAAPAARQSIGIRPRTELKQRLEQIAAENGRSLAQEVERRLEQSLEPGASNAPDFLSRSDFDLAKEHPPTRQLLSSIDSMILNVVRYCRARNFSEVETRRALRSAFQQLMFAFFWTGEAEETIIPKSAFETPTDTKLKDLPPDLAGHQISREHLLFSAALADSSIVDQTYENVIANVWSGDGKTLDNLRSKNSSAVSNELREPAPKDGGLIGEQAAGRLSSQGALRPALPFWAVASANSKEDK